MKTVKQSITHNGVTKAKNTNPDAPFTFVVWIDWGDGRNTVEQWSKKESGARAFARRLVGRGFREDQVLVLPVPPPAA